MSTHWPTRYQDTPDAYSGATISESMDGRTKGQSMILFTGPAGTGKSWQVWALHRRLAAAGHDLVVSGSRHPAMWVIAESLDIAAHRWDDDWLTSVCRWPGLLVVDDLGYRCHGDQRPNEWLQHAAYCVSEYRTSRRYRLIVTTNLTSSRMADAYGPAVASRLWSGAVIETSGADRRMT